MQELTNQNMPEYERPPEEKLRSNLTEEQYYVMCEDGTEHPYTSEYWENEHEGIYVDAATGQPLFTSFDKFPSECGWPSFSSPISEDVVVTRQDLSHGMVRTEVRSAAGDFHLGHVFDDGPKERGGLRYCINGAAIRFIPEADMEAEGYSYLLPYYKKRKRESIK
ncbi:peptide-methionine (R)-S-oxide reductase MsrB [Christensenella timonensis]|uniref:peptide-methionine (R)-S-oxide reductase MsrB n=1 Tax=Christensenella timonensis TaxID=1816678 RepID=UPI000A6BD872|nr:peptide-methionine (R)-S-oxide reductase MsrB [Christensenella timonensis]